MKLKIVKAVVIIIISITIPNIIAISLAKYVSKIDIAELSLQVKYTTTLIAKNADISVNSGYEEKHITNGSFEDIEILEDKVGWMEAVVENWTTTSDVNFELGNNEMPNSSPYFTEDSGYGKYYIEMNRESADMYYQDLETKPNDVIEWSLIHATRIADNAPDIQSIAVTVGQPDGTPTKNEIIVDEVVTSVTIDEAIKEGTKARWESTGLVSGSMYGYAIDEECSALALNKGEYWKEARGVYVVPEGQTNTRFGILSVSEGAQGNLLDNVNFNTLLGNVKVNYDTTTGDCTITGYWAYDAEKNANKNLVYYIKNKEGTVIFTDKIDMSQITTNHFQVNFKRIFDEEVTISVYHEDYQPT